jgi:HK97 family phage major capsid protein
MDTNEILQDLRDKLLDLNEQATSLQAFADSESRDMNEEESERCTQIFAEFKDTEVAIARRERIEAQRESLAVSVGRRTEPEDIAPQNREDSRQPERRPLNVQVTDRSTLDRGRWGWKSFGEFALASAQASHRSGAVDPRLIANAPTTVSTGGTDADGGYAVPPDFREQILVKVMGEDTIIGQTDQLVTSSNSITMPTDETTPWQSSGGVLAAWTGENAQMAQTKVALGTNVVPLHKLTALCPVTEELMSDAPAIDRYLSTKVPDKMNFKITDAILNGTGSGQPTGIVGHAATVTVAKETAQTADTVNATNIKKMYLGMYGQWRQGAVWLINQDLETQLWDMSLELTSSSIPLYVPVGGFSQAPFATLLGRPVIPTQGAQTLGDLGDIVFVNLSQYMSVTKTTGLRADVSMHLWFDYDTLAFRFILRIGGKPWHGSTIAALNGSGVYGAAVELAERA